MKHVMIIALGAAVLACTAGAVSAGATDFRVTSLEPGVLKGKQVSGSAGEQRFLIEPSVEIVCKKATVSGLVYAFEANAVPVKVAYGECTASGLVSVTVPEAEYEVSAEGRLGIVSESTIKVEGLVNCTVDIKPQAEFETVSYSPTGKLTKKMEVTIKVSKVEAEVSGGAGLCGKEGKDSGAKYSATDEIEVEGAEMQTEEKTLAVGDCVQVGAREGNYKDPNCNTALVKGNYTKILCRQMGIGHLRSFTDSSCKTPSSTGTWYETTCVERLPATHKWANNTCSQAAPMNNGAWELFKT